MRYKTQLDKIGASMIKNEESIAVAESVTSGRLQKVFSEIKDASLFYQGGITAYTLQQKCTHLFIDPLHAITCNCVSEKVAQQMALGICRSFKTIWGIAVTGYASLVPESGIKNLFACYAIAFDHEIKKVVTIEAVEEAPEEVQQYYVSRILEDFIECYANYEKKIL